MVQKANPAANATSIDLAAKDRIVRAQREAAMKGLPASMQKQFLQQQQKGATASLPPAEGGAREADLSQFKTVKDTLDAADPHRPSAASSYPSSPSKPQDAPSPLGSSLEAEADGGAAPSLPPTPPPKEPSLSIGPSYVSPDAIVTPQAIRTMFAESVEARTVANTALRKYISALNSKDYALAVAAYDGCREGGLRVDADTYAALLDLLLGAQQLKAGMELYQTMLRDRTPPNTHAYNALMRLCIGREAISTALRLFDEMPAKGRTHDRTSYELAMTAISMQPHPVDWQKAVQIFEKATAGAVDASGNSFASSTEGADNGDGAEASGDDGASSASGSSRRSRRRDLLSAEGTEDFVPCPDRQRQVGGFVTGRNKSTNMATSSTYNALMRVYMAMEPFEWRVVYNCYFEMRNSKPKVPISWESYHLVAEAMRRGEASRTRRVITYIDAWIQLTSIGSARFIMGFATYAFIIGIVKLVLSAYFTDKVQESQDAGLNVQKELPVGHETIAIGLAGHRPTRA